MKNLKEKNILIPKVSIGNLLSIDGSSESGSIALFDKAGTCIAEINTKDVGTHSQWLLTNIDKLLSDNKPFEVDTFATTIGPGSFTGLRIAITTLKGLAWSGGKKIIGLSTLRAMAMNIKKENTLICPVLDARKGQIYGAIYKLNEDGNLDAVVDDYATTSEEFVRVITACKDDTNSVVFMGKGLNVYGDYLKDNVEGATLATEGTWDVLASNVGKLAISGFGIEYNPSEITPLYLREDSHEFKKQSSKTEYLEKQVLKKTG